MGVRDLSSILLRRAPAAVTTYPSLACFSGKAFAVDGNLLCTKFYFATLNQQHIHPHAHLKAWHHFLLALLQADIAPIVVFDGQTRLLAKARENARRTSARSLQLERGKLELIRTARLRKLRQTWDGLGDRSAAVAALRQDGTPSVNEDLVDLGETEEAARIHDVPLPRDRSRGGEAAAFELRALYEAARTDGNPVYSKSQVLVSVSEKAFFETILSAPAGDDDDDELLDSGSAKLRALVQKSAKLGESHLRRGITVSSSIFLEAKQLIEAMGLPVLEPSPDDPFEAEGLCATLFSLGHVQYVVSEDTDVAVYGAPLLRRISTVADTSDNARRRGRTPMDVVDPRILRDELGLTNTEFVDFALLCGTDFTERIPHCGPANALALIQQYGSIEAALEKQNKYQPPDTAAYLETVAIARSIFLNLPPLPPNSSLERKPPSPTLPNLLRSFGLVPLATAYQSQAAVLSPLEADLDDDKCDEASVDDLAPDLYGMIASLDLNAVQATDLRLLEWAERQAEEDMCADDDA